MYASIRRYQTSPGKAAELAQRVTKEFVPIISEGPGPGFLAYYVVDAGNDQVASISIFKTEAEAKASSRKAAEWVKSIAAILPTPPDILAGAVTVHKAG